MNYNPTRRTHVAAAAGDAVPPSFRVRRWQTHDVQELGRLWEQALLASGVTSFGSSYGAGRVGEMRSAVMAQMERAATRKQTAACQARHIQAQLAAHSKRTGTSMSHNADGWSGKRSSASSLPDRLWRLLMLRLERSAKHTRQPSDAKGKGTHHISEDSSIGLLYQGFKPQEIHAYRQELVRLRRRRMWACFVAEAQPAEQQLPSLQPAQPPVLQSPPLCGYLLVSISQPLALLPAPLPSASPFLLHVDALAVCTSARRQGVATALLEAAEKLGRRWGRHALFLEVDASNAGAIQLYLRCGYRVVRDLGWPWRQRRKLTLCKDLKAHEPERRASEARLATKPVIRSEKSRSDSSSDVVPRHLTVRAPTANETESEQEMRKTGVFVWGEDED